MEQILWQKNMDRAIKECDKNTIDMLALLPPRVSAVMLIEMGKRLCEDDEWKKLTKKMKPTLREKLHEAIEKIKEAY
jgi:hypothetical protein